MTSAPSLAAALSLAGHGFAVFPCLANKAPACPGGFKAATTDADALRNLWRRWPGNLVGIATGNASDLAVLDIDAKKGGRHWWAECRSMLPVTRTIRTRSGGIHLYFRHAPGLRCSVSTIAPGIDVRADGGYAIAWHYAGLSVLHEGDLSPWPEWLLKPAPHTIQRRPERPRVPDDLQIRALVHFVIASPEGERNKRLFWAGCRMASMIASRFMSVPMGEAILISAATSIGLPEIEARRTMQSALVVSRNGQRPL